MAKTLQEDPSCQLCNILKKYILLYPNVEEYLKDDIPHLSTLRQVWYDGLNIEFTVRYSDGKFMVLIMY